MKLTNLIPEANPLTSVDPDLSIQGVTDHTDHVCPGDLFICRKGEHFDPFYLLPLVEKKGAAAIVAEEGSPLPALNIPCVFVKSIRETEADIWRNFYGNPERDLTLIGITGTNGKTSTALILSHILTSSGICCGYIGTLGVKLGDRSLTHLAAEGVTTPPPSLLYKALRSLRNNGAETVIIEVSSHALAQARVHGLVFDRALFTNLTEDHLDYHGTMDAYFEAKSTLFRQTRKAILNVDDPYGKRLFSQLSCDKTDCGVIENSSHRVEDLYEKEGEDTKYTCVTPYASFQISYPLCGAFNVYNTLLAITTALQCGVCQEQVRRALLSLPPIPGRMERLSLNAPFSVIIDYAHTPDAMEQAIKAARRITHGRVLVLFGAGGDREKEKRPIMGRIAEENADFCIVTSDNARTESTCAILSDILSGMRKKEKRLVVSDRRQAILTALSYLKAGDTLLLLGKGHEAYLITREGKQPFSEKEIVYSYVREHERKWS